MNSYIELRADYENRREVELVKEYFKASKYYFVEENDRELVDVRYKDRDLIRVSLDYNRDTKSIYFYGDKSGLFKQPVIERYEVLLKGDMFTIHDRDDSVLTTYNTKDWTILNSKRQEVVNLRKENNKLTEKYMDKLFLY